MNFMKYALLSLSVILVTGAVASTDNGPIENNTVVREDNPLVDYLLLKWLTPKVSETLKISRNDTSQLTSEINNIFGVAIFSQNGENIQIDYDNLRSLVKLHGRNIIGKILGTNDILLNILAQRKLSIYLDNYLSQFQEPIKTASFPIGIQARKLSFASPRSLERALLGGIFSNLIGQLLSPLQALVNQTLVNVSNAVKQLIQPTVPTDFFSSIFVSLLNEAITGVVTLIDNLRSQINTILTPPNPPAARALLKRSVSGEIGTISTRSVLDIILSPLRFLAGIILGPLRNILKNGVNYIFVTLRPVVGGIILGPLESLILAIITLIPCSNC